MLKCSGTENYHFNKNIEPKRNYQLKSLSNERLFFIKSEGLVLVVMVMLGNG